jgi:hypothetical protein
MDDELVPVMVPKRKLQAVYHVLGEADGDPGSDEEDEADDDDLWTVDDFRDMLGDARPSFTRMVKVMDKLSKQPGNPMAYTDLAKATGLSTGDLQGALSGFGRAMASMYGTPYSPLVRTWGDSKTDGQEEEYQYSVTPAIAVKWKAARSA